MLEIWSALNEDHKRLALEKMYNDPHHLLRTTVALTLPIDLSLLAPHNSALARNTFGNMLSIISRSINHYYCHPEPGDVDWTAYSEPDGWVQVIDRFRNVEIMADLPRHLVSYIRVLYGHNFFHEVWVGNIIPAGPGFAALSSLCIHVRRSSCTPIPLSRDGKGERVQSNIAVAANEVHEVFDAVRKIVARFDQTRGYILSTHKLRRIILLFECMCEFVNDWFAVDAYQAKLVAESGFVAQTARVIEVWRNHLTALQMGQHYRGGPQWRA